MKPKAFNLTNPASCSIVPVSTTQPISLAEQKLRPQPQSNENLLSVKMEHVVCQICGEEGHLARLCPRYLPLLQQQPHFPPQQHRQQQWHTRALPPSGPPSGSPYWMQGVSPAPGHAFSSPALAAPIQAATVNIIHTNKPIFLGSPPAKQGPNKRELERHAKWRKNKKEMARRDKKEKEREKEREEEREKREEEEKEREEREREKGEREKKDYVKEEQEE